MALPHPGMDAVPFTPLTAEFLDDMIQNIESVSAGVGLEDKSVTYDKLINPIAFSAVTTESKTSGEHDYTTFTEEFDIGGDFDHTTGIFTAPIDGIYSFTGQFGRVNNTSRVHCYIIKNGSYLPQGFGFTTGAGNGNADPTANMNVLLELVIGDEINLRGYAETGTAAAYNSFLCGHFIGTVV